MSTKEEIQERSEKLSEALHKTSESTGPKVPRQHSLVRYSGDVSDQRDTLILKSSLTTKRNCFNKVCCQAFCYRLTYK